MNSPPSAPGLAGTIARLVRQDRGRLLSALIGRFRNFDLAEDVLQDALVSAHEHWARTGMPANPQGWLMTVASRKAIDRLRKAARDKSVKEEIGHFSTEASEDVPEIPDDRLRLIFTCCHPALEQKSRIALTLRTLGGLTTPEIARAFLDNETTMGQRLSRAKGKIADAGIPYRVPGPEDWAERLNSVLIVIYLIFNEGYFASQGEIPLRQALCDEAIYLARMLDGLRPNEPETLGLLALMLTIHSRRHARLSGITVVPLESQDHRHWDEDMRSEAARLLDQAMEKRLPGPFQIQAAIAALHSLPGPRDWPQIVALYDSLLRYDANPVIRLNRAVALAESGLRALALHELAKLAEALAAYQPYHAARADVLSKSGHVTEALLAYDKAIAMAANDADAEFLKRRRQMVAAPGF